MMGLGGEVPGCVTTPPPFPLGWVCRVRDSAHAVAGEVGMPDFWTVCSLIIWVKARQRVGIQKHDGHRDDLDAREIP